MRTLDEVVVDVAVPEAGDGSDTAPEEEADDGKSTGDTPAAGDSPGDGGIHRLRDLDRRGRLIAAVVAMALLLAPVMAFAWAEPDWTPANDPALMALRSYDVGTSITPMTGQPSTSDIYTADKTTVYHPGPVHFYLLAPAIRVLGVAAGMLTVSLLINAGCLLIAAWVLFRRLGPPGGVIGAVLLGAITFTTGASTLVNPVSSNIARYPLLAAVVVVWGLLCGDIRLLPLAAALLAFTGEQHLSVLPTVSVIVVVGGAGGLIAWGRGGRWRDRSERRRLGRWGGAAVAVWLAIWSPVIYQQFFGRGPGNVSSMLTFASQDDRSSVGWGSAVGQAAHVLGLPPLLGRTALTGFALQEPVSPLTGLTAALVVAAVVGLGRRWRRTRPDRTALAVAAGLTLAAGLVTGSSVPDSIEQDRLSLYHWAWPLTLLVGVLLGLGALDLARRWAPLTRLGAGRRWAPALASSLAVLAIAVPALVNPALDRPSNELSEALSPIGRHLVEDLADQIVAHRDRLPGPVVLVERGEADTLTGIVAAVAVQLEQRGLPVQLPQWTKRGVHEGRLARADDLRSGLVLVLEQNGRVGTTPPRIEVPGRRIATVEPDHPFAQATYDRLVAQAAEGGPVRLSASGQRALDARGRKGALEGMVLSTLTDSPDNVLTNGALVRFLRDHPLTSPRLDPDDLDRLDEALPHQHDLRMTVYALTRSQTLTYAGPAEIGYPTLTPTP